MARTSRRLLFLLLGIAILGMTVAPAGAQLPPDTTVGEPDLGVYLPENQVTAGEEVTLSFMVQNDGDFQRGSDPSLVTTARAMEVDITDSGPFNVQTGPSALGEIADGQTATAEKVFDIPGDIDAGEYTVEVEVSYTHTESYNPNRPLLDQLRDESVTETHDVTIEVSEDQRFEIVDIVSDVEPGGSGTAVAEIEHVGDETVYDVQGTISPTGDSELRLDGGSADVYVEEWDAGANETIPFDVSVGEQVSDGLKPIEATFEYVDDEAIQRQSAPVQGSVAIDTQISRFAITDVGSDVQVGGTGETELTIENQGSTAIANAYGTLAGAGESGVLFDGGVGTVYIGDLAPNDSTTVTVETATESDLSPGAHPIELAMTYDDAAGVDRQAQSPTATMDILAGPSFTIDDLDDTLAVGYDGLITGTITNDGPAPVDGPVLIADPASESISIEDSRYALPDLDPGESATFTYPTDVSGQADAGPRDITFNVEYQAGDAILEEGPFRDRVVIDDARDEFSLSVTEGDVTIGETDEVVIEVTNERPETLSNIDALLYTDSPLSAPNDDAFLPALAPGESAEMTFQVSADDGVMAEPRPVELDFEYETERGSTELSDAYTVGLNLVDADNPSGDDGVFSLGNILLVGFVFTLGAGGLVAVRRYR